MSRIGKKPIPLPAGVKINVAPNATSNKLLAGVMNVEGPKGKLTVPIPEGIQIEQNGNILDIKRENDSFRAVHGLTRALAYNAITGVSAGYTRELDIVGVGFRAEVKSKDAVHFTLGYSHNIEFLL